MSPVRTASPKESSQRKGDPQVGAGYAGPLRYSAGRAAAELGAAPLRQSSPKAPGPPALLSASQGDPKGVRAQNSVREKECYGRPEKMPKFEIPPFGHGWFTGPLERRRATQVLADKGRGLSEARRAEFRSPRQHRVAQGTGRSPAPTQGRLFFAYFLLAKLYGPGTWWTHVRGHG